MSGDICWPSYESERPSLPGSSGASRRRSRIPCFASFRAACEHGRKSVTPFFDHSPARDEGEVIAAVGQAKWVKYLDGKCEMMQVLAI